MNNHTRVYIFSGLSLLLGLVILAIGSYWLFSFLLFKLGPSRINIPQEFSFIISAKTSVIALPIYVMGFLLVIFSIGALSLKTPWITWLKRISLVSLFLFPISFSMMTKHILGGFFDMIEKPATDPGIQEATNALMSLMMYFVGLSKALPFMIFFGLLLFFLRSSKLTPGDETTGAIQ